jgi:cbb3-type cytochrome oxidase subunit 3
MIAWIVIVLLIVLLAATWWTLRSRRLRGTR